MKKIICAIVATILILPMVANADIFDDDRYSALLIPTKTKNTYSAEGQIPMSIDDALKRMKNTSNDRLLISNNLNEYDPNNCVDEIDIDGFKMIILERTAPDKAFKGYDSGYPNNYVDGFPYGFEGEDVGNPTVWLCCDMMRKLPEYYRATSLANADVIFMIENVYVLDAIISVTDYKSSTGVKNNTPEFDTLEEMNEYIKKHQPVIDKITFYPVFGNYELITAYNTRTKQCEFVFADYIEGKHFAKNRDAGSQWSNMKDIIKIITLLESKSPDKSAVEEALQTVEFVPNKKIDIWKTSIQSEEYDTAIYSIKKYLWDMTCKLSELDGDETARKNYNLIISEEDIPSLINFANYRNYMGVDTEIETIRKNR